MINYSEDIIKMYKLSLGNNPETWWWLWNWYRHNMNLLPSLAEVVYSMILLLFLKSHFLIIRRFFLFIFKGNTQKQLHMLKHVKHNALTTSFPLLKKKMVSRRIVKLSPSITYLSWRKWHQILKQFESQSRPTLPLLWSVGQEKIIELEDE